MRAIVGSEAGWNPEPIPDLAARARPAACRGHRVDRTELRAAVTLLVSSRRALDALRDTSLEDRRHRSARAAGRIARARPGDEREIDRVDQGRRDGARRCLAAAPARAKGAARRRRRSRANARTAHGETRRESSGRRRLGHGAQRPLRDPGAARGTRRGGRDRARHVRRADPRSSSSRRPRSRRRTGFANSRPRSCARRSGSCSRPPTGCGRIATRSSATLDALVTLDSLYARARYAIAFGCAPAVARASVAGARGSRFATAGIRSCSRTTARTWCRSRSRWTAAEHTLLVSGPNTGGKTVLLKALALLSLMAQSGIPAPVGLGSTDRDLRPLLRRHRRRAEHRGVALDVQRASAQPHGDRPRRDRADRSC